MARPWRIQFPGAIYHVMARGNNREDIFVDDHDRRGFLALMEEAVPRFQLTLFAFCLMTNHYHLFLRTGQANLASALHWINSTFTARFNRRHQRCGHLFQGRYRAVLVAGESHWLHLSMYLHLNPVRSGLVRDPADYEWSSFRDYTRVKSRFPWVQPEAILQEYGKSGPGRRRGYRQACLALAGAEANLWEELRAAVFLGPREKLEELAARYRPVGLAEQVPAFQAARSPAPNLDEELGRVAQAFRLQAEDLCQRRRPNRPRLVAYFHLVENCGLKVSAVAKRLGVSPSAVTLGLQSLRRRMEHDPDLCACLRTLTKN